MRNANHGAPSESSANDNAFFPEKIFIVKDALHFPLTKKILRACNGVPVEIIPNRRPITERLASSPDPIGAGKKLLFLTLRKGPFVKPCPCTPSYIGCNYFIINSVLNCPLDCSYCILQHYLGASPLTVHVNLEDLWRELDNFLGRRESGFLRLGTGELSDSLALEHILQTAGDFIAYFRMKPRAFFEFKTKTARVEALLRSRPAENVVVSWSLNSEQIAAAEELGAPSVAERLEAARAVAARGFPVAFHYDPLIFYPGWKEDYGRIIEEMLSAVPTWRIRWVSLGSLRFPRALKPVIEKRFPASLVTCGELIRGRDGKLRYFKPVRLDLYRQTAGLIKSLGGGRVPVYFCMEDEEVWEKGLGREPGRKEEVESLLSPWVNDSKSIVSKARRSR
jgi:spore photoproduct lyase